MQDSITLSAPSKEQITKLESAMLSMPQVEIRTVHHFADGLYAREITIPAGCTVTGKVHSGEHLNIVSKGVITVWTEQGMKRVEAPFTMISMPGTKRVGYAHEETVWTTIHRNDENVKDLELLEKLLIVAPSLEYDAGKDIQCLG